MSVFRFIEHLQTDRYYDNQAAYIQKNPARNAIFGQLKKKLHPEVECALQKMGIDQLYSHQTEAIDYVREKKNVTLVTSTASGKTFSDLLPILDLICADPETRALLIYPTKALTQDQLRGFQKFNEMNPKLSFSAGYYDGDTPTDPRRETPR